MLAFGMPAFTPADVSAIAALANLELDPAETELYARQLAAILAYAEEIQQVDTTGVPPTAHIGAVAGVERDDTTRPSIDRRAALSNAPDAAPEAGLFKVPRVL